MRKYKYWIAGAILLLLGILFAQTKMFGTDPNAPRMPYYGTEIDDVHFYEDMTIGNSATEDSMIVVAKMLYTGDLALTGNIALTGKITVSDSVIGNGIWKIGNAAADYWYPTGEFAMNLVPKKDDSLSVGTAAKGVDVFSSDFVVDDTSTHTGVSIFNGRVEVNSPIVLGDAAGDTIKGTGRFGISLVPIADQLHDLGTPTLEWNAIWIDSIAFLDQANIAIIDCDGGRIDGCDFGISTAIDSAIFTWAQATNLEYVTAIGGAANGISDTCIGYGAECSTYIDGLFTLNDEAGTIAGDTANVVRGEIRDTATAVWNDSAGVAFRHDGSVAASGNWNMGTNYIWFNSTDSVGIRNAGSEFRLNIGGLSEADAIAASTDSIWLQKPVTCVSTIDAPYITTDSIKTGATGDVLHAHWYRSVTWTHATERIAIYTQGSTTGAVAVWSWQGAYITANTPVDVSVKADSVIIVVAAADTAATATKILNIQVDD